jgi:glyoxylase I family protein
VCPAVRRTTGVDHFDLVVSDLDRSLSFYRALLEPLGYVRASEIVGERGEPVVYLGGPDVVSVSLRAAQTPGCYDRYPDRHPPCGVRGALTGGRG